MQCAHHSSPADWPGDSGCSSSLRPVSLSGGPCRGRMAPSGFSLCRPRWSDCSLSGPVSPCFICVSHRILRRPVAVQKRLLRIGAKQPSSLRRPAFTQLFLHRKHAANGRYPAQYHRPRPYQPPPNRRNRTSTMIRSVVVSMVVSPQYATTHGFAPGSPRYCCNREGRTALLRQRRFRHAVLLHASDDHFSRDVGRCAGHWQSRQEACAIRVAEIKRGGGDDRAPPRFRLI